MSNKSWVLVRSIVLFSILFAIGRSITVGYEWLNSNYDLLLIFTKDHPDLSGWAQAVGGTIAILIAVFVPAYQRYTQNLDRRREEAARNHTLSLSCFYLLGDVSNYLRRLIHLDNLPRSAVGDTLTLTTLLTRIDTLERRESDWKRASMLYHARNYLLLAEGLTKGGRQDSPLDDETRVLITGYYDYVNKMGTEAKLDNEYCGQVAAKMNCNILGRVVFHVPRNKAKLPTEDL